MLFKNEHTPSLIPKLFFMFCLTFAVALASYLLFTPAKNIIYFLQPYARDGNFVREVITIACLIIYLFRLYFTTFVFLKRKMVWGEIFIISTLMSAALFALGHAGGFSSATLNLFDYFGILLYIIGSWLNTQSEYTRYFWKKDDNNKGKLYTEGLFKYSMHINYFGDVLLFSGLVLITQSFTLFIIPFAMLVNFVVSIIPRLDKYLESKYGNDFVDYSAKTKKLIPWIY